MVSSFKLNFVKLTLKIERVDREESEFIVKLSSGVGATIAMCGGVVVLHRKLTIGAGEVSLHERCNVLSFSCGLTLLFNVRASMMFLNSPRHV